MTVINKQANKKVRKQDKKNEEPNENKALGKEFDAALTRRILSYVKPYRGLAAQGILLSFLMTGLQPIPAFLQGYAIDHALTPFLNNGLQEDSAPYLKLLTTVVIGYITVQILEFALTYFSTITVGYLGQNVLRDIRADVFGKLQKLPISYFDQNPVGKLVTRVTSDVDAINQFITGGLISIITSGFLIMVYIGFMFSIHWQLALIALSVLPFMFMTSQFFQRKMRPTFVKTRTQQSIVNTQLNETITGIETVQLFNHERRSALDFDRANRNLLDATLHTAQWFSLFVPAMQILGQLSIALVLYFGARTILGEQANILGAALSVGTLYTFIQWTQALFQPIQDLAEVFNNLQAAMASSERIFEVLDTEEKMKDKENPATLSSFRGNVHFRDVWFSYSDEVTAQTPDNDDRWILRGVDLHIRAGESVALVGATGAGKTSITALVSRFYDVQRGRVEVDGHDVKDLAQHDLRKHVGLVLQDVFLFTGTIKSNLTLGNTEITDEQLEKACKYVGVHDYIMSLAKGYDTEVKERGATLSTGQKQLLAFARALLQNSDIILVLDEATANVDTEAELRIQEALTKIMKDRTSIIIAHRLSTIEHCDRIIVMRKGQIVEQGNHTELLAKGGYYTKLHRLQYSDKPSNTE